MKQFVCRYPFDTRKYKIKKGQPHPDFAYDKNPEIKYSVDFILPLVTPIMAVKAGNVILTKHDGIGRYSISQIRNLPKDKIKELAFKSLNFVAIDHRDKTFTEYCNLAKRKVVSKGQSVEEGELIGYTGMSGIMDILHLHFNATTIENDLIRSIPVNFIE